MTKRNRKRKIKKRFLLLNIVALVFLIVAVEFIAKAGDYYEMGTGIYAVKNDIKQVNVTFGTQDVVEMTGYHIDGEGQVIADFHSVGDGKTKVWTRVLFTNGEESHSFETTFRISAMGTIIEDDRGLLNFNGFKVLLYLVLGYLALALGVMIFSFVECLKTSQYSYRMIAYGGIALFLGILLTILMYKLLNNVIRYFSELMYLISSTGEWFLFLMLPVMAVSAIAVSVSNIWLMRHEGFRPVNALGIAVSVLWFLSLVVIVWLNDFRISLYSGYEETEVASRIVSALEYAVIYLISYFESMLLSTSLCAFLASRHTPPYDRDCIIILGCAIRRDGTLMPLLRGRVDSALNFEKAQYEKTGKHACFVPSGGQGPDEVMSEGEAMENYLLSQGVEPERIHREDKSVNTFQNMQFSREVIERYLQAAGDSCSEANEGSLPSAEGDKQKTDTIDDQKIAFATTNYHVFRGYILSKKNGFDAQGISAKTKWYFFPNAFLREFIGLLFDQILRHITVILCIVLVSIAFALMF